MEHGAKSDSEEKNKEGERETAVRISECKPS